ncbi:MAG: hypothetical protein Q9225_003803 [Loekoesia sp. 1 TL-2023]
MVGPSTVSERSSIQSSKVEYTTHNTQAPWTAARCQRLLRPLSSKLALLRREKQRTTDTEELHQAHHTIANTEHYDGPHSPRIRRRTSGKASPADEEWAPNPRPRKRIKRTYSSKSSNSQPRDNSSQLSIAENPSETRVKITIPSDFFQWKRQPQAEADAAHMSVAQEPVGHGPESHVEPSGEDGERLWQDRPRYSYKIKLPFRWKLTDGICKGVEALLKATEGMKARQSGAKDLFSTCLRRIPDYIAQEELWCKAEDPESDIDVSATIYSDLESLSLSETVGWHPLRQVVRAHGIDMVGNAVREGLIGINTTRRIIALCIRLRAYDEAEHLLQRLCELTEPLQKHSTTSEKTRSILKILDDFVLASGRHRVRYRTLVRFLSSGRILLDWIARHDMIETWNKVVQSVTQQDEHAGPAAELLRLAVTMHHGLPGDDLATFVHAIRLRKCGLLRRANEYVADLGYQTNWPRGSWIATIDNERTSHDGKTATTISSLMTVLCAIGLLRSATKSTNANHLHMPRVTVLQDIAVDAQRMMELDANRMFRMRNDCVAVALLAGGLVQATLCHSRQAFAESVPAFFDRLMNLDRDESAAEEGGSFLCAVADCCARGTSEDSFDHTQKIVQHIRRIAESLKAVSSSHEVCSRIGVAAALEYADATKHPKHLHWALDVEQAVTGAHLNSARRTPAKTPLRGQVQMRNGYRWEAGICEWVAKTPASAIPRPQIQGQEEASTRRAGSRESTSYREEMGTGIESSQCSSSGQSKTADMNLLPKQSASKTRKSVGASKAITVDEGCVRSSFFSHVYIEEAGDELSTSESSQETQAQKTHQLQQITNVASRIHQGRGEQEQRSKACKQRGTRGRRLTEPVQCIKVGLQAHDMSLESEDELSFL